MTRLTVGRITFEPTTVITQEMHGDREGNIYIDSGDIRIAVYKWSDEPIRFRGDECTIEQAERYIEALTKAVRIAKER
jgi:hypothetical protein